MIERVAKAICQSGKFETGEGTCAPACMDQLGNARIGPCRHALRIHGDMARAAIEAMREPTDEMVEYVTGNGPMKLAARAFWQGMIDEALK